MRERNPIRLLSLHAKCVLTIATALSARHVVAQATPTATRSLRFSIFAAANGTSTGLSGGHNLGVTSGLDVELPSLRRLHPALELRGTYPIDGGQVDAQRNILGGLRVGHPIGDRLTPYAFGLFGRGRIDYVYPGEQLPRTKVFYTVTSSNVISGGAGLDVALTRSFSVKADFQFDHQKTPITATGTLNSTAVNLGLVWRPHFYRRRGFSEVD